MSRTSRNTSPFETSRIEPLGSQGSRHAARLIEMQLGVQRSRQSELSKITRIAKDSDHPKPGGKFAVSGETSAKRSGRSEDYPPTGRTKVKNEGFFIHKPNRRPANPSCRDGDS
jgi:hypothetical protein